MRLRILVLSGVLSLALATPSAAVTINLSAILDGAQANAGAGTGSPGTGLGTITFDTTTNGLTWIVTWSGLLAPVVAAHFHGPALPNQNAGIQVGITAASPSIGNTVVSASQAADLLAGLWYLNVHSTAFPGGEIRGQVLVPEPGVLLLLATGFAALSWRVRRG